MVFRLSKPAVKSPQFYRQSVLYAVSLISSSWDVCRPRYTQHVWQHELRCCQSVNVEQSTVLLMWHHQLRTIQMAPEHIFVWESTLLTVHHACLFVHQKYS